MNKLVCDVAVVGAGPVGLLLAKRLRSYGLQCVLIERRRGPRTHPQAHFLSNRTMEIFRSTCFEEYIQMVQASPPSSAWRHFVYCSSVNTKRPYLVEDQFTRVSEAFFLASPTSPLHLPQHTLENILLPADLTNNTNKTNNADNMLLGYELNDIKYSKEGDSMILDVQSSSGPSLTVQSSFVVGCDGAHSKVRQLLFPPLEDFPQFLGNEAEGNEYPAIPTPLTRLVNVHFTVRQLHKHIHHLAMLYFVYNADGVAVVVGHKMSGDQGEGDEEAEFVCQIPFFPPYQTLEQDFTEEKVHSLLQRILFGPSPPQAAPRISIKNIGQWAIRTTLSPEYAHHPKRAQRNQDSSLPRVFLAGDAAHQVPPSGGQGLNLGIGDVDNLSWKIAYACRSLRSSDKKGVAMARRLLNSYTPERRGVASRIAQLSVENYYRCARSAEALGLPPRAATLAYEGLTSLPMPLPMKRRAFAAALQGGLEAAKRLQGWGLGEKQGFVEELYASSRVDALRRESLGNHTLPLFFPRHDLLHSYAAPHLPVDGAEAAEMFAWRPGRRMPHLWVYVSGMVCSTVDLPALAHRRHGSPSAPPPVLLVVSSPAAMEEARLPRWEALEEQTAVRVVVVKLLSSPLSAGHQAEVEELLGERCAEGSVYFAHERLQALLSFPHLCPRPQPGHPERAALISGAWKNLTQAYAITEKEKLGEEVLTARILAFPSSPSTLPAAALVLPDGVVLDVQQNGSPRELDALMTKMKAYFGFS